MRDPTFETTKQTLFRLSRQSAKESQEEVVGHSTPALQRDPTTQLSCRLGDASCAGAHAETLNHATVQPAPDTLLRLQRQYGNRFVQRVVDLARQGEGEASVAPAVEQTIQSARGAGQPLDSGARAQMEPAFDADFGGVRVHTDGQADQLNRSLSARAFTTGQDIFFKQGEYSPGSSTGRELLAHELTHVVQQNGDAVQTKLTLGQPGDRYEQEADSVARAVVRQEQQPVQRQGEAEDEEKKEKPLQAKLVDGWLQRQAEEQEEEESVRTKPDDSVIQRQNEEETKEEEPLQTKIQYGQLQPQPVNLWGERGDGSNSLYVSRQPINGGPYYGSKTSEGVIQFQNGKTAPKEAWKPSVMPGKRAKLDPGFLAKLDNISGRMQAQGYPTKIAWGRRTLEDQVKIYARGRTFAQFKTGLLAEAQKGHVTPQEAQTWIDHYDPKVGKNAMPKGFKAPVTWTLRSAHRAGKAADVVHPKLGWNAEAKYWKALKAAAQAEGLQIGPPASDNAHVQDPNPWK